MVQHFPEPFQQDLGDQTSVSLITALAQNYRQAAKRDVRSLPGKGGGRFGDSVWELTAPCENINTAAKALV
nr:hypothetical protein HmN_000591000 [Hymenolepis microstoma]